MRETGEIIEGHLPIRAARLVKEWSSEHRDELRVNWELARALEPLNRIAGADQ
ncbi:MAG: DUF4160 domain-containing protein [Burkholderiaceae bacterium]